MAAQRIILFAFMGLIYLRGQRYKYFFFPRYIFKVKILSQVLLALWMKGDKRR